MKRQTSRGTRWRGGFRPRHLVLSSRLGAPLQRDGLGRVVVREERVLSCGETAQRLDYDSFGRVLCDTNPGFQPFGFQGGLYGPDTGLVEFGCRWYDAETGRWISKDPILLDCGLNVYAFSYNCGCMAGYVPAVAMAVPDYTLGGATHAVSRWSIFGGIYDGLQGALFGKEF